MQLRFDYCLSAFCAAGFLLQTCAAAVAASPESICLKSLDGETLEGLAVACYSDAGCAYVEARKGEPLPDYDVASVAAALGREKIEGIVTSSAPIMKQIIGYGYKCTFLAK